MKFCRILAMSLMPVILIATFTGCTQESDPTLTTNETMAQTQTVPEKTMLPEPENPSTETPETADIPEETPPVEPALDAVPPTADIDGGVYYVNSGMTYPIENPSTTKLTWWTGVANYIYNSWDITDFGTIPYLKDMQEATGIEFVITAVSTAEMQTKYQLMCASGDLTDIMPTSGSYTGGGDQAVEDDILIDLTELAQQYAPDYSAVILSNEKYLKEIKTDNGYITDIIGAVVGAMANTRGPVIRQDWLDKLGMKAPVTYDDWYTTLSAFKTNIDCSQPLLMVSSGIFGEGVLTGGFDIVASVDDFGSSFSGSFYKKDGEVRFGLVENGFREYLIMVNSWYNEGIIGVDFINNSTSSSPEAVAVISSGNTGLWCGGSDYFGADYIEGFNDPDYDVSAIPYPVKNEGDIIHNMSGATNMSMGVAISTRCKDPGLALQVFNYCFTVEGFMLCNYGVEGISYNLVNGEVVFTEMVTNNPDGLSLFQSKNVYTSWGMPCIELPSRFDSLYTNPKQLTLNDIWDSNRDAEYYLYGSMNTDEATEFSNVFADINTYCSEMVLKFLVGEADIEQEWDTFVNTIYGHGLQTCLDIRKTAEERYLAA